MTRPMTSIQVEARRTVQAYAAASQALLGILLGMRVGEVRLGGPSFTGLLPDRETRGLLMAASTAADDPLSCLHPCLSAPAVADAIGLVASMLQSGETVRGDVLRDVVTSQLGPRGIDQARRQLQGLLGGPPTSRYSSAGRRRRHNVK